MTVLPGTCDLPLLGLDPSDVTQVILLHERWSHSLYRLTCQQRSFVLKWFDNPTAAAEGRAYELLRARGVPTQPVHGHTANALLLEDLATSADWRLATEADVYRPETGAAVARWYRALHAAGRVVLASPRDVPSFLRREIDSLDAATVLQVADHLQLADYPVWRLATSHVEELKGAMRALPETLNHNDFHWTNLALSRQKPELHAIVFDYHLLGIGMAYSDCRNVIGALGEPARASFWIAYGDVDEREAALDAPISILCALRVAAQQPRLPRWAEPLMSEAVDGGLESKLRRAIESLQGDLMT